MHYYSFNIGDYKSHTEHLSDTEDLAYRRMLDWYYLHETPLPTDVEQIARLIRMRSHCDSIAVVLREYFTETPKGWRNQRADVEIAKAGEKSNKASESAKARWSKRKDANAMRMHSEGNATHNTIHNTQDTIHKNKKPRKSASIAQPEDVDQQVWADWVALRKAKRAPVTETVVKGARKEAAKAGMTFEAFLQVWCQRGSQGLQADWLKPNERNPAKSFAQVEREEGWRRWEEMTGRQHPDRLAHEARAQGPVIDMDSTVLEIGQ